MSASVTTYANIAVRTVGDLDNTIPILRRLVAAQDPTVPLSYVQPLSRRVAFSVGTTRFASFLALLFAGVAVALLAASIPVLRTTRVNPVVALTST